MLQFGDMKGSGYFVQMFLQGVKYALRVLSKKVGLLVTDCAFVRVFPGCNMVHA